MTVVQILQFAIITQKAWRVLVLAFDTPALMDQQAPTIVGLPVLNGIGAFPRVTRLPCFRTDLKTYIWPVAFSVQAFFAR